LKRQPSRELLDHDDGTPDEVRKSLQDVRFLNTYFGGISTTVDLIQRVAHETNRTNFTLLEVAAGNGDVPEAACARLRRNGIEVKSVLLDRLLTHLGPGDNRVAGDALKLPFRDHSFDLVSCCLFVHHLAPTEVNAFVTEALRCARIALLINDLVRNPIALATAHLGRAIYRSRITVNDAPASIRQAYTPEELREMLCKAPVASVDIARHWFYRMGAVIRPIC
jgi:ubiquinone/menaquinone biosynthesis C-methylase UbiE